jgi:hypothetical protein
MRDKVGTGHAFSGMGQDFSQPFWFQAKKKSAMIAGKNCGSK